MGLTATQPATRRFPLLPPRDRRPYQTSAKPSGGRIISIANLSVPAGGGQTEAGPWLPAGATLIHATIGTDTPSTSNFISLGLSQQGETFRATPPQLQTLSINTLFGFAILAASTTIPLQYRLIEPARLTLITTNGTAGLINNFLTVAVVDPQPVIQTPLPD